MVPEHFLQRPRDAVANQILFFFHWIEFPVHNSLTIFSNNSRQTFVAFIPS